MPNMFNAFIVWVFWLGCLLFLSSSTGCLTEEFNNWVSWVFYFWSELPNGLMFGIRVSLLFESAMDGMSLLF